MSKFDIDNFPQFTIIPTEVLTSKELSLGAKVLYSVFLLMSRKNGFCSSGNTYLADMFDVSTDTISRWTSELNKKGYVRVELVKDETNGSTLRKVYTCMSFKDERVCRNADTPTAEMPTPPRQKCRDPHRKNAEYNNTSLNKTSLKDTSLNNILTQSVDCEEKEKKEKPKTQNRVVTDRYCAIYEDIFHRKFVPPRENYWIIIANRLKQVFKYYSLEDILTALDMAKNDSFILEKKYDLSMILSDGMMLRLSNPEYNKTNKATVSDKRKAGENFVDEDGIPF